jgi:hypothetical protein
MNAMAKKLADEAHFLFTYAREAHAEKGPDYAMGLGVALHRGGALLHGAQDH